MLKTMESPISTPEMPGDEALPEVAGRVDETLGEQRRDEAGQAGPDQRVGFVEAVIQEHGVLLVQSVSRYQIMAATLTAAMVTMTANRSQLQTCWT